MNTTFVLASGCANGLQMPALERHCCSNSDCNVDALWYAAQMHGFCTGCCGVRTSLQHLCCNCGSTVMRNVDAAVVHSVRNIASTVFSDCIADVAASVHHRACRLLCKRFAPCVAMLSSSAASAKQYGRRSFALLILRDAVVRDTDVCGNLHRAGGCILHDALIAVCGEISEDVRTYFNEYLQCADATASGENGYLVGIAHTPDGKCADVLSFPNFKTAASRRLKSHAESAESAEWILNTNRANITNGNVGSRLGATEWTIPPTQNPRNPQNGFLNTNHTNFSNGNVGSRLGATEWTGTLRKRPKIACRKWRKVPRKSFGIDLVLTHRLKRGAAIKACLLTQSFLGR